MNIECCQNLGKIYSIGKEIHRFVKAFNNSSGILKKKVFSGLFDYIYRDMQTNAIEIKNNKSWTLILILN